MYYVFQQATVFHGKNTTKMNFNAGQNPKLHRIHEELIPSIELRAIGDRIIEELAVQLDMDTKQVSRLSKFAHHEPIINDRDGRVITPAILAVTGPGWSVSWNRTDDEIERLTENELLAELATPVDPDAPVTVTQIGFAKRILESFEFNMDGGIRRHPTETEVNDATQIMRRLLLERRSN